jgi:hypothetical protein
MGQTMSELRFLPNPDSDHEGTQVALLTGHITRVYETGPDGKPGTAIELRFHKAAISAGCSVVGMADPLEQKALDQDRQTLILDAIESVLDSGDADDLDANGKPKLAAVKAAAGFNLSKSDLDAAFAVFMASLDD